MRHYGKVNWDWISDHINVWPVKDDNVVMILLLKEFLSFRKTYKNYL